MGDLIPPPLIPDADALASALAIYGPIVWAIVEVMKKAGVRKKLWLAIAPLAVGPLLTALWYAGEAPVYEVKSFLLQMFYGLIAGLAATGFYKALERKASDPPEVINRRPDLEIPGR